MIASGQSWTSCGVNLRLSDNNKTITKITESHSGAKAIGSIGWSSGKHIIKIRVDGAIDGTSTVNAVYWMNIGVATHSQKDNLDQSNLYIKGETYFCNSFDLNQKYYDLGIVSGNPIKIPPKSIVFMYLDCDEGTLAFALNDNRIDKSFFKIYVPYRTMLYPCVHMFSPKNSATFVV